MSRRRGTTIAISFCNQPFTRELVLALLDPSSGRVRWVDIQHHEHVAGAVGLARRNGRVYVAIQVTTPSSRLHIYDEESFELITVYDFAHARDVHSVCPVSDDRLIVVSTGTDELYELTLDGDSVLTERPIWRLPGTIVEAGDQTHVNSATVSPLGMAVSYCRSAEVAALRGHLGGGIMLVEDSSLLASGIQGPHSLVWFEDDFYYCRQPGEVASLKGASVRVGGFARGLCFLDRKMFVGSSGKRWRSRSTGRVTSFTRSEYIEQRARVFEVDFAEGEIAREFDLRGLAIEIYDLLPVETDFGAKYVIDADPGALRAASLEYELHARESRGW